RGEFSKSVGARDSERIRSYLDVGYSFDSLNPDDYIAGFPMHPHRGIETVSYVYKGRMVHKDTLGNEDEISDGEVQWMNSGSGIEHEEKIPAAERLLGVQLWLNLPKSAKMSKPTYHSIRKSDIEEIEFDRGKIRILTGNYKSYQGYKGDHLPLNYYDIHMYENAEITLDTLEDTSVMIFTLIGDVYVGGERIKEKTAVKLTSGNELIIKNADKFAQVLFIESKALNEPVAWAGPIVMNTQEEIREAYIDLHNATFIKDNIRY
uniref:pirin family protein n=2 Tax=Mediterraneibacter glycyrrhizinilyticus TaxID=342942 RepID=UPI000A93E7B0